MHKYSLALTFFVFTSATALYKSQAWQDQFVNDCFFNNKKNGFFLDIGAHDGTSFSNTYFFEKELGWQGICFEPLPHLFAQLKACRNCVCINACVSPKEGTVSFLHLDSCDEMLSGMAGTYDQRQLNTVMNDISIYGGQCKLLQLPAVNINEVLKKHDVTHVDFLSLDTEGSELEILKSIDFSRLTIDVITVENNFDEPIVRDFLEAHGFTYVTRLHVDDVYVREGFCS